MCVCVCIYVQGGTLPSPGGNRKGKPEITTVHEAMQRVEHCLVANTVHAQSAGVERGSGRKRARLCVGPIGAPRWAKRRESEGRVGSTGELAKAGRGERTRQEKMREATAPSTRGLWFSSNEPNHSMRPERREGERGREREDQANGGSHGPPKASLIIACGGTPWQCARTNSPCTRPR